MKQATRGVWAESSWVRSLRLGKEAERRDVCVFACVRVQVTQTQTLTRVWKNRRFVYFRGRYAVRSAIFEAFYLGLWVRYNGKGEGGRTREDGRGRGRAEGEDELRFGRCDASHSTHLGRSRARCVAVSMSVSMTMTRAPLIRSTPSFCEFNVPAVDAISVVCIVTL